MHNREPHLQAKAMMHIYQLRTAYDEALAKYDVLLTPLNSKLGSKNPTYEMNVQEKTAPSIGATLNTCQFNCTGRKYSRQELMSIEKC
jgi:amidase